MLRDSYSGALAREIFLGRIGSARTPSYLDFPLVHLKSTPGKDHLWIKDLHSIQPVCCSAKNTTERTLSRVVDHDGYRSISARRCFYEQRWQNL